MKHLLVVAVVLLQAREGRAYSGGAPPASCRDMIPHHGPSPQTSPSPFVVLPSKTTYSPREQIEVTLEARCGETFMGFLLQARRADPRNNTGEYIGGFTPVKNTHGICDNGDGVARGLTHSNPDHRNVVKVLWTAPDHPEGHIIFKATFVKEYAKFWVEINSALIHDPTAPKLSVSENSLVSSTIAPCTTPSSQTSSPTPPTQPAKVLTRDKECRVTLGCFDDCTDKGCTFTVTWAEVGNNIHFRLKLVSPGNVWMAVGFSDDRHMGNDSVTECVEYGGQVQLHQSFNDGYSNLPLVHSELGISNQFSSIINGVFECSFLRQTSGAGDPEIFDLRNDYYVMFAHGTSLPGFWKMPHKPNDEKVTSKLIDFQTIDLLPTTAASASPSPSQTSSTPPSPSPSPTPSAAASPSSTPKPKPTTAGIDRSTECGKTLGCFDDCDASCTFMVTWAKDGDNIQFRMKSYSTGNSWMAIGFSNDENMGDDSVSECVVYSGVVKAFQSANTGYSNHRLANPQAGLSDVRGSVNDGVFECSFLRQIASDGDQGFFNLTQKWYLLYAHGQATKSFGKIMHSSDGRTYTSSRRDFINTDSGIPTHVPATGTTLKITTTTTSSQPSNEGLSRSKNCGKTEGCFDDCDTGCTFTVTWAEDGENIRFRLRSYSIGNSWMAVGFSSDTHMGDDSVSECVIYDGVVKAFQSTNTGYSNSRPANPQVGFSDVKGSVIDGVFECSFLRLIGVEGDDKFFNLTQKWYLLFARGQARKDFGKVPHSDTGRSVTSAMVDFRKFVTSGSAKLTFPLVKVHGSLMCIAWMFCASLGLILARYYKPMWPDTTVGGVKVWFQIHRSCMGLTFLLTVAAFVTIFVEVQGYSQINGEWYKKSHPILGIIVTALVIINPVMAYFRPGAKAERRPLFNWAHFLVGTVAYVLAVITIFFGMELGRSGAPDYMKYILAGYVAWQLIMEAILEVMECLSRQKESQTFDNIQMENSYSMGQPRKASAPTPQTHFVSTKQLLLGLHLCVVLGATVTVIFLLVAL